MNINIGIDESALVILLTEYFQEVEIRMSPDKLELAREINKDLITSMKKHVDDNIDAPILCLAAGLCAYIRRKLELLNE